MIAHAGLVAQQRGGRWRGVLIEGPSGAGKSDLALRALDAGFTLVADDRTILWASGGRLFGRAPETLYGLMEVRGLDVIRLPALPLAEVALVARHGAPERLPQREHVEILEIRAPLLTLDFREASAPAKLGRAMDEFDSAAKRRI